MREEEWNKILRKYAPVHARIKCLFDAGRQLNDGGLWLQLSRLFVAWRVEARGDNIEQVVTINRSRDKSLLVAADQLIKIWYQWNRWYRGFDVVTFIMRNLLRRRFCRWRWRNAGLYECHEAYRPASINSRAHVPPVFAYREMRR